METQPLATFDTASALPAAYSVRPTGLGSYRAWALVLALGAAWVILSTGYELYLVPDTVVGPGALYFCLAGLGFAALYRASVCHEIWLDPAGRRYRARWNRLAVGDTGTFADFAGASVKPSADGKRHDVWLGWKSLDRNPLLLASESDGSAADEIAARFTAMVAASDKDAPAGGVPESTPVSRKRNPQQWSVVGGIWLVILAYPFAGVSLHYLRLESAYTERGVRADARVIGRNREYSKGHTYYYVSYALPVQGRTYNGRSITSWARFQDAEYGSAFRVEYLPEDPRINRAEGASSNAGWAMLAAFLGFGAVGCLHLATGLRLTRTPGVDV